MVSSISSRPSSSALSRQILRMQASAFLRSSRPLRSKVRCAATEAATADSTSLKMPSEPAFTADADEPEGALICASTRCTTLLTRSSVTCMKFPFLNHPDLFDL